MKRILSMVAAVAILAFAGAAYATGPTVNDHTCQGNANCSTTTNNTTNNNNTTNQGGTGIGVGGQGGQGGDAKATATGGNASQSQGQIQQQSNQIKNSGNSSSTSNATGGSVKNSGNSSSKSSATGVGVGVSGATANNGGVSVNEGSTKVYAAPPSMGTAALVAAPETCMGSTSASLSGGNGIVGAGIGFGKTYESRNCNRRMNSRYLLQFAQMTGDSRFVDASVALLGQDEDVAAAYEAAGIEVPKKAQPQVKVDSTEKQTSVPAANTTQSVQSN